MITTARGNYDNRCIKQPTHPSNRTTDLQSRSESANGHEHLSSIPTCPSNVAPMPVLGQTRFEGQTVVY